jgi:hypothetical protein
MGARRRRWLYQSTHSRVAYSTAMMEAPRATPVDHLRLEQAVDRLCQGVVIAVADTADGQLDARSDQALCVP